MGLAMLWVGMVSTGPGCGLMDKELAREKANPDNQPLDRASDMKRRREAENREPLGCQFYLVKAYDQTRELLDLVAEDLQSGSEKALDRAVQGLRRAGQLGSEALDRVDRDKASGIWRPGMKFRTAQDGLLDETTVLSKLTQRRDEAQDRYRNTVWPRELAALRKKLGARTEDQNNVLEQEGRPMGLRGNREERCWLYAQTGEIVTYCWDARGMLVRRTVKSDASAVAPAPAALKADVCEAAPVPVAAEATQPGPDRQQDSAKPAPAAGAMAPASPAPARSASVAASPPAVTPAAPAVAAPVAATPVAARPKIKLDDKERMRLAIFSAYTGGTFAAGACEQGSCLQKGWNRLTPDGPIQVRCQDGDCSRHGWNTTYPGGEQSRTVCTSGDCQKDGWITTRADGKQTSVSCNFGDCWKSGWTTTHADESHSTTSCNLGDCGKQGWITVLSNGQSLICRCTSKNCAQEGAQCN